MICMVFGFERTASVMYKVDQCMIKERWEGFVMMTHLALIAVKSRGSYCFWKDLRHSFDEEMIGRVLGKSLKFKNCLLG
jgi:hypothetical protein